MALIYCNQCGKQVSDRAQFCPHCGALVDDKAVVDHSKIGATLQTRHASTSMPNVARIENPPKKRGWLPFVILAIVLAAILAGLGGWYYRSEQIKQQQLEEQQARERARQDSIAEALRIEQARLDSIAAAEQARRDSLQAAELQRQREEAKLRQNPVYLYCHGDIGSSICEDFVVDGTTGYYKLENDTRKRTLKLKSHDKKSSRCVMEAYLSDRYIGFFDGEYYNADIVDDYGEHHYFSGYRGSFHSVKGVVQDFYVYAD